MSDEKIVPLPTIAASDAMIEREVRRQGRKARPAQAGDLVAYCVDPEADTWTLAPVACVDDDGVVMRVTRRDGRIRSLWREAALDAFFVIPAADHDLERLRLDRWRKFRGLVALREAVRPSFRRPPS
ncbi:hypothetical protein [Phenylobacterium sp.]|uniref:hypothetical protein n=1 Tax=Phenylobacterium sp. TaxID=1871053 RepID=UPI003930C800